MRNIVVARVPVVLLVIEAFVVEATLAVAVVRGQHVSTVYLEVDGEGIRGSNYYGGRSSFFTLARDGLLFAWRQVL